MRISNKLAQAQIKCNRWWVNN